MEIAGVRQRKSDLIEGHGGVGIDMIRNLFIQSRN